MAKYVPTSAAERPFRPPLRNCLRSPLLDLPGTASYVSFWLIPYQFREKAARRFINPSLMTPLSTLKCGCSVRVCFNLVTSRSNRARARINASVCLSWNRPPVGEAQPLGARSLSRKWCGAGKGGLAPSLRGACPPLPAEREAWKWGQAPSEDVRSQSPFPRLPHFWDRLSESDILPRVAEACGC